MGGQPEQQMLTESKLKLCRMDTHDYSWESIPNHDNGKLNGQFIQLIGKPKGLVAGPSLGQRFCAEQAVLNGVRAWFWHACPSDKSGEEV